MPSAKKTPNYNLTQYADNGTDKVSFMGDYNTDMGKVDTALHDNAAAIATKADKATTYSKADVDSKLSAKADSATTYSKNDVDSKLSTKADTATTYSKTDVDTKLGTKADTATTYRRTDVDAKLDTKADTAALTALANTMAPVLNTVPYGYEVLCSYFLSTSERLHYAVSHDGLTFSHPTIRRNDVGESVRDPSCIYVNGQVYFTWTRPTTTGGGAFGTTNTIAIAQLNPTSGTIDRNIITPTIGGQTIGLLWAPDFYLEGNTLYIIFSAKTNTTDFEPYEIHATNDYANPLSYSAPRALGIAAYGGIDHHIIKDDLGTYHDLSADGSVISHRSSKTLIGGWSGRTTVDSSWRYMEAPTSYRMANGDWRVFFDGGGLQGDYNPGSNLLENDGLMLYADFSNDLSQHTQLNLVPSAMRHCGLTLVPSTYLSAQNRLESGSTIGGALLTLSKDIGGVPLDPIRGWIPQWDTVDTFGAMKNTGFGAPNNATQGVLIEQPGLYLLSGSVSMGNLTNNSWLNGHFRYYPNRDTKSPRDIGGGSAGAQAFKAPDGDTISTLILPAIPVILQPRDEVHLIMNGMKQGAADMRANNCYMSIVKIG